MTQQLLFAEPFTACIEHTADVAEPRHCERTAATMTRRDDPETSFDAALSHATSGRLRKNQLLVLWAVCKHPGATYAELSEYINANLTPQERIKQNEPARRLPELETAGLVETRKLNHQGGKDFKRECQVLHTKCRPWWPTANGQQAMADTKELIR